jgi:FeS assembly protein IscX
MNWTDIYDIAIELEERHPDKDNLNLRFTDLRDWILAIDGFEGAPDGCSESILEAIQMAWIDERDS